MDRLDLLSSLAQTTDSKIVLLVLDGLGDLRTADQPETPLQAAATPNLDALAARSALGRLDPVLPGVTPGSGPGHLGLFGYDPSRPEVDIGRGVLEALGLGLTIKPGAVAARGNFASLGPDGNLTDRRAGRIPTAECVRLCEHLSPILQKRSTELTGGLAVTIHPGEGYRFVLLIEDPNGEHLVADLEDTDPQRLGVPPLPVTPKEGADSGAQDLADRLQPLVSELFASLAAEPRANGFLLRGFSGMPQLPTFQELYDLKPGCFAGYPLYRGVSTVVGMDVIECGKTFAEIIPTVAEHWDQYDYFFIHVKQTDQAGEDGDFKKKTSVIEDVDAALPELLALGPTALAITGDHSTPTPMKAHSWHPIPLLLNGPFCFIDETDRFDELQTIRGHIGTRKSHELMGLLMANAGKLMKFGA